MISPATVLPSTRSPLHPFRSFLRRIGAVGLRHIYLHMESWPRLIEMLYWPIINMATWGFTSLYFIRKFTDADIRGGALISGALFVEIFIRTSTTMLMLFLEEIWSRNLGHLFASPISFFEYTCSLVVASLTRLTVAMIPAILLAKFLFGFSIASFGISSIAYIFLLAFSGCWYGLLILSLLLRFGLAAEWMAWMGTWLIVPLISPYYPVSILPTALQWVAHALPATYVFETMKGQIATHQVNGDNLWIALGLNVIYLLIAALIFSRAYRGARQRGGLLQMGE